MAVLYRRHTFKRIGSGIQARACSYTPSVNMKIKQFSFTGKKMVQEALEASTVEAEGAELHYVRWALMTDDGGKPKVGSNLDAGYILVGGLGNLTWRNGKLINYTVTLNSVVELTKDTKYWFSLHTCDSTKTVQAYVKTPFLWATTVENTASYTPVATIYDSQFTGGAWTAGDNNVNLTLDIETNQAGVDWQVVIDGNGYMTPDNLASFSRETISSGLASTRGGQSKYSQLRYPYSSISQDNWQSGSGQVNMDDQAAFLHSRSLDTRVPNQMIIGPKVYSTGQTQRFDNEGALWKMIGLPFIKSPKTTSTIYNYLAQRFKAPTGGATVETVGLFVNKYTNFPFDGSLQVGIIGDNAGKPNSMDIKADFVEVTVPRSTVGAWSEVAISATLSASTYYWLVLRATVPTGQDSYYSVGVTKKSTQDDTEALSTPKISVLGTVAWDDLGNISGSASYLMFRINEFVQGALNGNVYSINYGEITSGDLVRGSGTEYLLCTAGKAAYKWSTDVWESISAGINGYLAGGVQSTLASDNLVDSIFFNGKYFVTQGYNYPMRMWDGTNWLPCGTTNILTAGENGEFSTSTAGWTADGATLASTSGGHSGNYLKITNSGAASGRGYASVTTEAGKWYEVIFYANDATDTTGEKVIVKVGTGTSGASVYDLYNMDTVGVGWNNTWTRYNVLFKATTTTSYISFYVVTATASDYAMVDTVSVVEAPVGKVPHVGKGFLWVSTSPNTVKRSNNGTTWTADITVGESLYQINAMANFQGKLLVGKEDGVWSVDDNDLAQEYLIFRELADPWNCSVFNEWSGMLFISVQGSIWRWQGSQYKDVGPTDKRGGPTSQWPNTISRAMPTASALYCSTKTSAYSKPAYGGLMAYDGMGWHHLTSTKYTGRSSYAMCATSEIGNNENRIWWGEGAKIMYCRFPKYTNNRYDWEGPTDNPEYGADYNSEGGYFISSWFDGGVKDAIKFWNRITVVADIPTETSIDVYYATDGEDYTSVTDNNHLGTLNSFTLTDEGTHALQFPAGLSAKSLQIIMVLKTENENKTPRVRAYNIEAAVRQPPVYVYSCRLLLADNVTKEDGSKETTRTANDMEEELEVVEATDYPVTVSFPHKSIRGIISFQRENTERYINDGNKINNRFDRVVQLSVIEAT